MAQENIDKLTQEFTLPKHIHKLKLVERPPNENSPCNNCFLSCKETNFYASEMCRFQVHVSCACRGKEDWKLKQHDHFLILQRTPTTFHCNACGKEDNREASYLCTECSFWIHHSCANLNPELNHGDHDHPLYLEFSLPQEFENFNLTCDVCSEKLLPDYWVYQCGPCRFFVHVKCDGKRRKVADDNIEAFPKLNLALLPEANETVQLVERFLKQNGILENLKPSQIDNFQHKVHPLVLSNNTNKDKLVCNGCIRPIVDPCYYSCQQCSYFLHVTCSQLPGDLELYHPEHPLYIRHSEYCCFFRQCSHCKLETNGWWFECKQRKCDFRLDMKCALLPKAIAHKSHRHPLSRISVFDENCSACAKTLSGSSYGCEACRFYLGNDCALSPLTITVQWDEHPLTLIFHAFTDHPDEFLCRICETYAHPKYWLYHCRDCHQSFHPHCIPQHGLSRNIKFGSTIQIAEHSLELVEKGEYMSRCGVCQDHLDKKNALLCTACNLHICSTLEDVVRVKEMQLEINISDDNKKELREAEEELVKYYRLEEDF
ncbi:uncharacterized protein LOC107844679 [Capsicum annuum]|uniref:uncharacterized protein LOC107844679 n=1 Tax=Capsicum annuum TaxID=4072 RepID=UPI001FB0C679|nr:uncharacterized protein LOC107844679 [Capsicum annuum]